MTAKKMTSPKPKSKGTTEKTRKAAIKEIGERIASIDGAAPASGADAATSAA